jgi:SSS family solute:Na+ symporter
MAFFQGPALAVLLAGIFTRRSTGTGAFIGFLCGVATSVGLYSLTNPSVLERFGWQPLFQIPDPFLYFSVWAFLVAAVVIAAISLATQREPEDKLQYVFHWRRTRA